MRPWALSLLLLAACAGTQAVVIPESARPVWPLPPEAPAVRWAASFPDPNAPRAPKSKWRRFWTAVAGVEETPRGERPLLERPFGLAVAGERLYVADPDARTVQVIEWRKQRVGAVACAQRSWVMPMAVAVAADGVVFVADGGAGVVVRVDGGRCTELGRGALVRPTGVALLGDRLYVVDPPEHKIVAFARDGRELFRFGARGAGVASAGSGLNFPTALAASGGQLLVVDALNFRIARFAPDGAFLGGFGEPGDGNGAFGRPKAVAVDGQGRIYVSDAQHDVVLIFDAGGRFRLALGGSGGGLGRLSLPAGLALQGNRLFVADSFNHRVQVYDLLGDAP